jgi:sterol desaturase/sphingolipid hydroxylase (fatty acid hydroxylase superfamily)
VFGSGILFVLLVGLLGWESVAPFFAFFKGQAGRRVRHDGVNLLFGAVNGLFNATLAAGLWLGVSRWAKEADFGLLHRLDLAGPTAFALAVLLLDLWMYWWHRLCHVVPLLWRFHRVHHSDPWMDVSTAYRFHFGEMAASAVARVPLIVLLGLSPAHIVFFEALMFGLVLLQHANVALPPALDRSLRWVVVTPFMHKVHHSDRRPETDSNYCSLFSWWDRVFGTYRERSDCAAIRFGLSEYDTRADQTLAALILNPFRSVPSKKHVANPVGNRDGSAPHDDNRDCQ